MPELDLNLDGRYQHLVFRSRHTLWLSILLVALVNFLLFVPTGVWTADLTNADIHSTRQLLGMLLVFLLVPMWMLCSFFVTQRHSLALAQQLEAQMATGPTLSTIIARFPARSVTLGLGAGLLYALAFNIPTRQLNAAAAGELPIFAIIMGQVLLWCFIGILLFVRLHIAGLFAKLGRTIPFSIFEPHTLSAFARVGMLDVVIVVGGLAIATVQSLDAQFRLENYLSAIFVAGPAAIALLIRPMWQLHKRMYRRREVLLEEVRTQIQCASEGSEIEDIQALEDLLQRRDRVKALNTWPLDIGIWKRLFFYILIPPLAWVGAALMEAGVNRTLGL